MSRHAPRLLAALGPLLGALLLLGAAGVVLGGQLDRVRGLVEASGAWGPVVFVLLHVLVTLVPVPKNLLATIAGALFGIAGGTAVAWVAAVLSAAATFALARRLGRERVAHLTGPRLERAERVLRDHGLLAVVIARLTPLAPFTLVSYAAGVSAVTTRHHLVGSALGVVPGTVAYVAVGASAGRDTTTVALALGAGLVLFLASLGAAAILRHRA